MSKEQFLLKYWQAAVAAGRRFRLNPVCILAQAAQESAWGTSYSTTHRHNLFGMMATTGTSEFWHGKTDEAKAPPPRLFRVYDSDSDSVFDFARLIATNVKYAAAYAVSSTPAQYALAIAASPYITERNGDNRAHYARAVALNASTLATLANRLKISLAY